MTRSIGRMMSTSRPYLAVSVASMSALEAHHGLERVVAPLDLAVAEALEPLEREVLDGERGHHRAEDHRLPHRRGVGEPTLGEVAEEAPGEGVPGPRRVEDALERVRRGEEELVGRDHHRAV